jgi:hypothetical protein
MNFQEGWPCFEVAPYSVRRQAGEECRQGGPILECQDSRVGQPELRRHCI